MNIRQITAILLIAGLHVHAQQPETHLSKVDLTFTQVVQAASTSVALIETEVGSGSGFYASSTGWVITANHVVTLSDGSIAKNIRVESAIAATNIQKGTLLNGRLVFRGYVVARDEDHDLALLKLDGNPFDRRAMIVNGQSIFQPRQPAMLCDRRITLKSGDPIFTIGHPLGDLRQITTRGIIASAEPTDVDNSGALRGTYLVDMLINHGNSGGPVFAETGCVIGMVDAITLRAVEAVGPDHKSLGDAPGLPIVDKDGKPVLGSDGQPMKIKLNYSTGLGMLIPQQYILKLLDQAGLKRMHFLPSGEPDPTPAKQ